MKEIEQLHVKSMFMVLLLAFAFMAASSAVAMASSPGPGPGRQRIMHTGPTMKGTLYMYFEGATSEWVGMASLDLSCKGEPITIDGPHGFNYSHYVTEGNLFKLC